MSPNDAMIVFDRRLVRARRDRAAAGFATASFLKERAVEDVLDRLEAVNRRFERALDIGSHGGWFARALAARPDLAARVGWLAETDLSARMLDRRAGPAVVCDEEALPFAPQSFNLIVSTLSAHWVNDLPGLFAQARAALAPDGLFICTIIGGRTLADLRTALMDAEMAAAGGAAARVSPFADAQDLGGLLQRAGFALPVTDAETVRVRYRDPVRLLQDLRAMGETSALHDRPRRPLTRTILMDALARLAARAADPDGRIAAAFDLVTATGWAPHESQQKPLRPGSAQARLADALGAVEQSAGERTGR
jgi:SAM-dependent methyltransferase